MGSLVSFECSLVMCNSFLSFGVGVRKINFSSVIVPFRAFLCAVSNPLEIISSLLTDLFSSSFISTSALQPAFSIKNLKNLSFVTQSIFIYIRYFWQKIIFIIMNIILNKFCIPGSFCKNFIFFDRFFKEIEDLSS